MLISGKDLLEFNPPEVRIGVFRLLTENNQLPSPKFGEEKDLTMTMSVQDVDESGDNDNKNFEEAGGKVADDDDKSGAMEQAASDLNEEEDGIEYF